MSPISMIEKARLVFDSEGRLSSYRLCLPERVQYATDESPLLKYFRGKTVAEILQIPTEVFCERYPAEDDWPQVIFMRHFLGLRGALELAVGRNSSEGEKFCTLKVSRKGDGSTVLEGEINFGHAVAELAACRQCRGCGRNHQKMKRRA